MCLPGMIVDRVLCVLPRSVHSLLVCVTSVCRQGVVCVTSVCRQGVVCVTSVCRQGVSVCYLGL